MGPPRSLTLSWEGKDGGFDAAAEAAPPRRSWATEGETGWLLEGDNLRVLRGLAATHAGAVTLAYMDPPFFTNREHAAWLRKAGAPRTSRTRVHAFDDRWADLPAYLDALGARLDAARELLAPHGSIVVHVDPKTSHYVRVLGDEIFGADAFASEIVWRYRRWPSKTPNFQRVHDVLLRWRKDTGAAPRWNQPYEPLAASTLATWGTNKQRAVFAKDGRRARSSSTAEKTAGVPMGDVWEIGVIAPIARERTGYPSQKPEALLERLVGALSSEGDLVLDPYAGSGPTLAVAHRMKRGFVGIDASPVALRTTRERLEASGTRLEERDFACGPRARAS
ncbi:MAG TPA: site-specific DNA-methyltransferase [Polyangiaceae bacterium]|nr:site-specific DNA-methyltransferase [Polyangiaceae bacterium]